MKDCDGKRTKMDEEIAKQKNAEKAAVKIEPKTEKKNCNGRQVRTK